MRFLEKSASIFPVDHKVYSYLLLTRSLCPLEERNIQLACVKHIASVHSEPGSNSYIHLVFFEKKQEQNPKIFGRICVERPLYPRGHPFHIAHPHGPVLEQCFWGGLCMQRPPQKQPFAPLRSKGAKGCAMFCAPNLWGHACTTNEACPSGTRGEALPWLNLAHIPLGGATDFGSKESTGGSPRGPEWVSSRLGHCWTTTSPQEPKGSRGTSHPRGDDVLGWAPEKEGGPKHAVFYPLFPSAGVISSPSGVLWGAVPPLGGQVSPSGAILFNAPAWIPFSWVLAPFGGVWLGKPPQKGPKQAFAPLRSKGAKACFGGGLCMQRPPPKQNGRNLGALRGLVVGCALNCHARVPAHTGICPEWDHNSPPRVGSSQHMGPPSGGPKALWAHFAASAQRARAGRGPFGGPWHRRGPPKQAFDQRSKGCFGPVAPPCAWRTGGQRGQSKLLAPKGPKGCFGPVWQGRGPLEQKRGHFGPEGCFRPKVVNKQCRQ